MRIFIASEANRNVLIVLFLALLQELEKYKFEILPTYDNSEWMVDNVFLPAAMKGEPVLIAELDDKPVGATFVVNVVLSPEIRSKAWVFTGMGTYVLTEFRGTGVGKELRNRAEEIVKRLGGKRITTSIANDNVISMEASKRNGYKAVSMGMTKDLT